ncbi:restriction endonuclease subunit S [Veillonella sp. VA141]|uniref:restriction endonuclease subunit S n=1 Tax=Veillonella sp. VA141 TaxID=741833 RepID=UPI000F8CC997|nr:restriction endonuclease subunit S [Veillonella sp. VA141]
MIPQQLRDSILQLAIEGKLVEQRPEEGTGEELYQLIQEEKLHFSKQQKFKSKEVINTIIEDEWLSEIPSSWKWVRLGDVFDVVMGQSVSKDSVSRTNQGIEFHQGKINFGNKVLKKSSMATNKPLKIASEGAVLLCVRAPVGKVNITDRCICIGRGLSAILPYGFISSEFLYFWLMAHENIFIKKSTGTTFKAITKEIVKNLLIPLPPLREQKRILEKIEAIFPIIDRYENAWQKLNELNKKFPVALQKSILQEAIQGKLCKQRDKEGSAKSLIEKILLEKESLIEAGQIKKQKDLPPIQEDETPFDIPDNWCWERLGNISTYNQSKPKVKAIDLKQSTWVLDLEDIEKNTGNILERINAKEKKVSGDKVVFYKGQLLYSKLRPYLKKILIAPDDGVCTPELVPFNVFGECNTKYILSVLKSPYVDLLVNSVTYGVKMPRVGVETMLNLLIPIPPLREQDRLVKTIESSTPLIEKLKRLI